MSEWISDKLFAVALALYGRPYGNTMDNEPFGPARITIRQKLAWWVYHQAIARSVREEA